jgi:hypothetical protein
MVEVTSQVNKRQCPYFIDAYAKILAFVGFEKIPYLKKKGLIRLFKGKSRSTSYGAKMGLACGGQI